MGSAAYCSGIHGLVERPLVFTVDELKRMPAGSQTAMPVAATMLMLMLVLMAPDVAEAAGDLEYGEYLSGTCVTCHGGGEPAGAIPNLERLSYDDFVQALEEYRSGIRTNAAMVSVARGLGDEEIEALAAFYTQTQ